MKLSVTPTKCFGNALPPKKPFYFSKNFTFLGMQIFMFHLRNQPNQQQESNLVQYNDFVFQMASHHKVCKNPLYFCERYSRERWRHCMLYASHKTNPLLKFIEKDEVSVNLEHNHMYLYNIYNHFICYFICKCHKISTQR